MLRLTQVVYKLYRRIVSSIAFYPSLMAFIFLIFALAVIALEYQPVVIKIKKSLSFLLVQSKEDARMVLTTLVASIISLMVFSFSMVMVVLNRTSTYMSPRVLPGLISSKKHQFVLGFYLGTIIYSLIIIINIQKDTAYQIPALGVLLAMIFGIHCLILFIYFIHNISQSIQVDQILQDIFEKTYQEIEEFENDDPHTQLPDTSHWRKLYTKGPGYFKRVDYRRLTLLLEKYDLQAELLIHSGFFVVADYPFLKISGPIDKPEDLEARIRDCFEFYVEDRIADHYLYGIRLISEIAVKALSPGINDPGTAIKAVDMLSILFIKKMAMDERLVEKDNEGKVRLIYKPLELRELLFINLVPIREYGKRDATVMLNLLEAVKNMFFADGNKKKHHEILIQLTKSLIQDAETNTTNTLDRTELNKMLKRIRELCADPNAISLLKV